MSTGLSFSTDLFASPVFLKTFAAAHTIGGALIGGASAGMYLFSIPVIKAGREFPTLVMLRQFRELIALGIRYMQSSSYVETLSGATLIYLLHRHPDPEIARRWKFYAAALGIGAQALWYERVAIFPTNDSLGEMETELDKAGDPAADEKVKGTVLELLEKWRGRHVGRMAIRFTTLTLSVCGLLF